MKEHERYSLTQSPLFRLKSKSKLSKLLGVPVSTLKQLEGNDWYSVTRNEKRELQTPIGPRRHVHNRLKTLLGRIHKPQYVYSGKPGTSYVDNGKAHLDSKHMLKLDISRFYDNSSDEYIFRFYKNDLQIAVDVAHLLTNISTYNAHIPTGSPVSQLLAYWAYKDVFDAIKSISDEKHWVFTLYVDDMAISSQEPIAQNLHVIIDGLLMGKGLHLKRKKTRYIGKTKYKTVTGCVITPSGEMRLPNKSRVKVLTRLTDSQDLHNVDEKSLNSLKGLLISSQQVEKGIFSHTMERIVRKSLELTKAELTDSSN